MMPNIIDQVTVCAPIEDVFNYVAEFANTSAWDPGVRRSKKLTPGDLKVGDRYDVEASFAGLPVSMVYEVQQVEAPYRVVLHGTSGQSDVVDDIRFEAIDETHTKITWSLKMTLKGPSRLSTPLIQPFLKQLADAAMGGLQDAFRDGQPSPDPLDDTAGRLTPLWRGLATAMDTLIAPAFSRPGYEARRKIWDDPALDVSLAGKTMVVTGANSGIGYATALGLARRQATVIMACRNAQRASDARAKLLKAVPDATIYIELVDMGDLDSVEQFANRLSSHAKLDGLIHNAGMLVDTRQRSAQGYELTFAVHVLGPFLLTRLLSQSEQLANGARVIFVSSGGMYTQRLKVSKLIDGPDTFDGAIAYAQAKRAQVILARMWATALAAQDIVVSAMHPGWVDTPGVERSLPRFYQLTKSWLRTPAQGADTILWLAASPDAANVKGEFYFDRAARMTHLPLSRTEHDDEEAQRLWSLCSASTQAKSMSTHVTSQAQPLRC